MAFVGGQLAGKNSRVIVAGVVLRMASWKATWHGDDLDTTNFESAGTDQGAIGVIGTDWNIGGDWNSAQNFYTAPPGLYPRDDLGQLFLYERFSDPIYHSLAYNRVISAENGSEVRGKVSFSATGKANGVSMALGLPTGNA